MTGTETAAAMERDFMTVTCQRIPVIPRLPPRLSFRSWMRCRFSPADIPVKFLATEEALYAAPEELLEDIGKRARRAEPLLRTMATGKKNQVLKKQLNFLLKIRSRF